MTSATIPTRENDFGRKGIGRLADAVFLDTPGIALSLSGPRPILPSPCLAEESPAACGQ